MVKKEIRKVIKINLLRGKAKNAPPVGPILGQFGLNIQNFIKDYNITSQNFLENYKGDIIVPALITIYTDKSFIFELKLPPTSFFIKYYGVQSVNLKKKLEKKISLANILTISQIKMPELNTKNSISSVKTISGTATTMGYLIFDSTSIQQYEKTE